MKNSKYFDWLYHLVFDDLYTKNLSYRKLLLYLYNVEFEYSILNDANRADDGKNLRDRFSNEYGCYLLDKDRPCSILEMLIGLSIRCENHIMDDSDIGDRTAQWFWNMIVSLGLGTMSDDRYNKQFVDNKISIFLERRYESNGKGGLFTIENCEYDLRDIEIWYQMCLYLDSIL